MSIPFNGPDIPPNPAGWGPTGVPEQFKDMPYQAFNKADRIGKIADWTVDKDRYGSRGYRFQQHSSGATGQFTYHHEIEDSTFQLVDTSRAPRTLLQRAQRQRTAQQQKKQLQRERDRKAQAGYATAWRGRGGYQRGGQRGGYGRGGWNQRGQGRYGPAQNKTRQPSVIVQKDWKNEIDLDFQNLRKLKCGWRKFSNCSEGYSFGVLAPYDLHFDSVTARKPRPLRPDRSSTPIFRTTTIDDPVVEELIRNKEGNVFGTDVILAALMCCTRSVYSWDVRVRKFNDELLVFDKAERAKDFADVNAVDTLTVCETSKEPPSDENSLINQPRSLAQEAVFINHNFRLQVINRGSDLYKMAKEIVPLEHPDEDDDRKVMTYKAYKYRRFNLGTLEATGKECRLVVRTQYDAFQQKGDEVELINIHAFNEWDDKHASAVGDWREKLDTQKGAVLSAEWGNNSFKVTKWTMQALLGNVNRMKIGFVSRVDKRHSDKHHILAVEQFSPQDFANNIGFDASNAFGILRYIINLCFSKPNGEYLIMKQPEKPAITLYSVPKGTFDPEDEADLDDEDDFEEQEEADEENVGVGGH